MSILKILRLIKPMSLNTTINYNDVISKLLWIQKRTQLLSSNRGKLTFNNDSEDDLNEQDEAEGSDVVSSCEETSFSDASNQCDTETDKTYTKNVCDGTTQCSFLNIYQKQLMEFDDLKSFLMQQIKPTPFVLEVMAKFIKSQQIGKYISRGVQADINLNICDVTNKTSNQSNLDKLYSPLKDIYTIDVFKNDERPMTAPTSNRLSEVRTRFLRKEETKLPNNVLDHSKRSYSKPSQIPKLIMSNFQKDKNKNKNGNFNSLKKYGKVIVSSLPKSEAKPSVVKSAVQERPPAKPVGTAVLQKVCELSPKASKIPVTVATELDIAMQKKSKTSLSTDTMQTAIESKTPSFQDVETSVNTYSSSKTIVPAVSTQNEIIVNVDGGENSKPNFVENQRNLSEKILTEQNDVFIGFQLPEAMDMPCAGFHQELLVMNQQLELLTTMQETNDHVEKPLPAPYACKIKPPLKKQKSILKDRSFKTSSPVTVSTDVSYSKDSAAKSRNSQNSEKSSKKEKTKHTVKSDRNYNNRFILDNKVTYVLNDANIPKEPIRSNIRRTFDKPNVHESKDTKSPGFCSDRTRTSSISEKPKKLFYPKESKFATYPRRYEDLKRNRNKQRAYVLVKNDSKSRCSYSSHEPFKVIPINRSCENSKYSLLTNNQSRNSYSYLLISPEDLIKQNRTCVAADKQSDVTYSLSDSTVLTLPKGKHFKSCKDVPRSAGEAGRTVKSPRSPCGSAQCSGRTQRTNTDCECCAKFDGQMIRKPSKRFAEFTKKYLRHDVDHSALLNEGQCMDSNYVHSNERWKHVPDTRLEEWAKDIKKTENTLNKLRKKISSLSTVLKDTSRRHILQSVENKCSRPFANPFDTNKLVERCACCLTENNEQRRQVYKLPEKQRELTCTDSAGAREVRTPQGNVRCNSHFRRPSSRCSCQQVRSGPKLTNDNLNIRNKSSLSDKFPCMPSVPLHLLVPHRAI